MKQLAISVEGKLEQHYLLQAEHDSDYRLVFTHRQPGSQSHIKICIIASGTARVKLDATVIIEPTATGSQAWLDILAITRNQAQIIAAPNLCIRTSQTKAGHSLSTRHISDEQLFYLASRGISPDQAEQLIIASIIKSYQKGVKL